MIGYRVTRRVCGQTSKNTASPPLAASGKLQVPGSGMLWLMASTGKVWRATS
jgi:hypothetical protein